PVEPPTPPPQDPPMEPPVSTKASLHDDEHLSRQINQLNSGEQSTIEQQEGALKNAVVNVEHQVVAVVLNKVTKNKLIKNDFNSTNDIISKTDRKSYEQQLQTALATFYGIILPLIGTSTMSQRMKQFGKLGSFKLDAEANHYIKLVASRAA